MDKLENMSVNQRRAANKALSALEAMAAIWAAEIRLGLMAKTLAESPEVGRADRIYAMLELAFTEGAYRHYLDASQVKKQNG